MAARTSRQRSTMPTEMVATKKRVLSGCRDPGVQLGGRKQGGKLDTAQHRTPWPQALRCAYVKEDGCLGMAERPHKVQQHRKSRYRTAGEATINHLRFEETARVSFICPG